MVSTKNSQNPSKFENFEQLQIAYSMNFGTHTNTASSFKQKMEIIHLLCFMTQILKKKDSKTFPNTLAILEKMFNTSLQTTSISSGMTEGLRAYGILCDDLLWGTEDTIQKPEGFNNLQDIKNKIINYFNDEWMPF